MCLQGAREFSVSPAKERVTGSGKDKVTSGKEESDAATAETETKEEQGRSACMQGKGPWGRKWQT